MGYNNCISSVILTFSFDLIEWFNSVSANLIWNWNLLISVTWNKIMTLTLPIKTIVPVLKILTCTITSITDSPIGLAVILEIMTVLTFTTPFYSEHLTSKYVILKQCTFVICPKFMIKFIFVTIHCLFTSNFIEIRKNFTTYRIFLIWKYYHENFNAWICYSIFFLQS